MLVRPLHLGLVGCLASACSGKPTTTPEQEPAQAEASPAAPAVEQPPAPPPGPTEFVQLRLSIAELGGIFAGIEKTNEHWSPDSALDLTGQLQAMLLSLGFGPGFYESFDMRGQLAVDVRYPHTGGANGSPRPQDIGLAATIPTIDARRLLQGMPPAYQPQPLSEGMWQLLEADFQLLMREQPKALELAAREADFALASQLVGQLGPGRRIRAHASNLPKDELDPASLLGLDPNDPASKMLAGVLGELSAIDFELELGDDRDVEMALGATAPFAKLGLDPIGAPRQQPSALAQALPGGAIGALELSWGDPALLLKTIDTQVPINQIPAPFNELAVSAVTSVKSVLSSVHDEVILSFYVSNKGEATIVLAAKTKDETAARNALRSLLDTSKRAFDTHLTLVGQDPQQKYTVTYKTDAIKVGQHKADHFTVSVPKAMQDQAEHWAMFLGKKQRLELVALAAGDTAVLTIGAGAKRVASDVGRSLGKDRKTSLESDGGLALARRTTNGCQICVAIDPLAVLATRLRYLEAAGADKERAASLRALDKLGSLGQLAFATVLRPGDAQLGVAAPQSFVFADPAATKTLRDAWEHADESSGESAEAAMTPAAAAGG